MENRDEIRRQAREEVDPRATGKIGCFWVNLVKLDQTILNKVIKAAYGLDV